VTVGGATYLESAAEDFILLPVSSRAGSANPN